MNTLFEILFYTWAYIILGLYCKEALDNWRPSDKQYHPAFETFMVFCAPPALIVVVLAWMIDTTGTLIKRLLNLK